MVVLPQFAVARRAAFNWQPVIDAIIEVESEGNDRAVSGNSCGAMQITPVMVRQCNDILKKEGSKKRFTLADRYSRKKSKEMFLLFQKHFNPEHNIEKAIRSWNGGLYSKKRVTDKYYRKVMAKL